MFLVSTLEMTALNLVARFRYFFLILVFPSQVFYCRIKDWLEFFFNANLRVMDAATLVSFISCCLQ